MRLRVLEWIAICLAGAAISGCLLNSVHSITKAPRWKPDAAHAIVVIGIGLDATWPYTEFELIFDEYSAEKQAINGNCFHYNRIEVTRPSSVANVRYYAFEVPANVYVYSGRNANAILDPSYLGHAFIASPGAIVYFGDYVFVGDRRVEFRRDIEAARASVRAFLPPGSVLTPADPTTAIHAAALLCTP